MIKRGTARRQGLRVPRPGGGMVRSGTVVSLPGENGCTFIIGEPRLWWHLRFDPQMFIEAS